MDVKSILAIIFIMPLYGFGIGLHADLIDKGEMFFLEDLVKNASLEFKDNSLINDGFMNANVQGPITSATIDLGLTKVLVDPNPDETGDEYFDNLLAECSFHSMDDIDPNSCVICKIGDKKIPPEECKDFWIDFEGVGDGEHQDNASHQDVLDYLFNNFGMTLTVDFNDDDDPSDDEVTTYNSFRDGGCDTDIEHELKPGDDPTIGNLLIMREDQGNNVGCQPNDRGAGGTMTFKLDEAKYFESVDVVDHDTGADDESIIRAYQTFDENGCTGSFVEADIIKKNFENSLQKVVVNAEDVLCFEIIYNDSGGFTNFHFRCVPCEGAWIDFEEGLTHGSGVDDGDTSVEDYLFNNFGITLTVDGNNGIDKGIIYDSRYKGDGPLEPPSHPNNGCDFDIEHQLTPDDRSVGNLLVMMENNNQCQPNDSGSGGTMTFMLEKAMYFESIDVVDHDNPATSEIRTYLTDDCTGSFETTDIPVLPNVERSLQRVFVNENNVHCFEIVYNDSGGFTNIHLECAHDVPPEEIWVMGDDEHIIAKGQLLLDDGYTGSDHVSILLENGGVDVQKAKMVEIDVFTNSIPTQGLFDGDVIIADDNEDAIISVDLDTGVQTIISADDNNRWDDPENLLIDSQGRLLVAEGDKPGSSGPGSIFIVNADGSVSTLTTGGFFADGPEDLVEDAFGNIFVADDAGDIPNNNSEPSAKGRVIKVTPGGVQSLVAEFRDDDGPTNVGFENGKLEGITIDNNGDLIVVGGTGSSAKVIKVDPITGDKTVISSGDEFLRPEGVAVAANGDIFVADGNPSDSNDLSTRGQIVKVNPGNGAQTVISSGIPWVDPSDVEIVPLGITRQGNDIGGFLLVTDDAADDDGTAGMGALVLVDPSDGSTEIISADGFFDSPEGLFIVTTVPPENTCEKLPPPPPQEECPECEKPHFLTVRYDNDVHPDEVVRVEVYKNADEFGNNDKLLAIFDPVVNGQDITIDGSDFNANGKVEPNTAYCIIFDEILSPTTGTPPPSSHTCVEFHTSCSQPLFVGDVHPGDFGVVITVVSGTDASGMPVIPDLSCKVQ